MPCHSACHIAQGHFGGGCAACGKARIPPQAISSMKSAKSIPVVDRLVSPLGHCLTPESARRLLALKPDAELQALVDEVATRHSEGQLSSEEESEYGRYVCYA